MGHVRTPLKGRGSVSNINSRFDQDARSAVDDGWASDVEDALAPLETTVRQETARSIISRNQSPDIPFNQSINPYRGCEHGCIYCYARPTHAYLNHSPGLDFETLLYAKHNAADVLKRELSRPTYRPEVIVLGANTDPYQPIEKRLGITRQILEVLEACNHPVGITTKSASVTRDIDILSRMAQKRLVRVYISITSLDNALSRTLEPRASAPAARLAAVRKLTDAGIPTGVLVAPVIPALTDEYLEKILYASAEAGAVDAHYILLRLPHEVAGLFQEWLHTHYPLKAQHVMNRVRDMRGGKDYESDFSSRMRGTGVFAQLLQQRYARACAKVGLNQRRYDLDTSLFTPPATPSNAQMSLF